MNKKGFTIGELLIAIGIMAAVSVISIVGVQHLKKELSIKKADETAKSLYVAMENRINELKWNGRWKEIIKEDGINLGTTVTEMPSDFEYWISAFDLPQSVYDIYSFSDNGSFMYLDNSKFKDLNLINDFFLPFGSIEESVRTDSRYFVEYNPFSATVYSVIYISDECQVSYDELAEFMNNYGRNNENLSPAEARKNRGEYVYKGKNTVIGYYGGGIAMDIKTKEIKSPDINIINRDDLVVNVINENEDEVETYVELTGITSKKSYKYYIDKDKRKLISGLSSVDMDLYSKSFEGNIYKSVYEDYGLSDNLSFILDSISDLYTSDHKAVNMHFAENFSNLIPGEDIEVKVTFWPTNDYYALPKSDSIIINSLFYEVSDENASIACIRHLENLSTEVSGINGSYSENIESLEYPVIQRAFLNNDISFLGINNGKNYNEMSGITDINGISYHSYLPVNNSKLTYFEGNSFKIYDLYIEDSDFTYIGLFGEVKSIEIYNLGLISNPENPDTPLYSIGQYNSYAGSFVGKCNNVKLLNCYSTTQIISFCEMIPDDIYVGGLVGKADGDCEIDSCYLGGFAPCGKYNISEGNISVILDENRARIGGLVGEVIGSNTYIKDSYSNQSIRCTDHNENSSFMIGGLIGSSQSNSIEISASSYHCAPIITQLYFQYPEYENDEYIVGGLVGSNVFSEISACDGWYIDSFFSFSNSYLHMDSENINVKSIDEAKADIKEDSLLTYPISSALTGLDYPFPDSTGLGHHYGDWQDTNPVINILIKCGHGIESIDNSSIELTFGHKINLSDLGVKLKKGYANPAASIEIKDSVIYDGDLDFDFYANVYDTKIEIFARTLMPPKLNFSSLGNYIFGYENGLITADYKGNHDYNAGIRLHYEIGYTDENSNAKVIEEEDWKLKENAYVSIINIDSTEYTGLRTYYITAYAFDGVLESESCEKINIDIIYKKIRQPVKFYSGGGWFYD